MTPSELSNALWDNVERVVTYLLPNGKKAANEWTCGSVDGEKGSSLKVNMAGKRVWSDFSTGESGDLLDLWCATKACQLHVAMTEAKALLGIKDDDHHFEDKKKKFDKPKKQGLKKANDCYAYLEGRGISKAIAEQFKVTDAVVWHRDLKRELPAVGFPYIRDGELLQVKRISTERPNDKKVIMAEANCEPCLFGWQVMPPSSKVVVICEGEIDCMSFYQYSIPALSVPFGGGKGAKQDWIEYEYHNLDRFEEIYLCLDNDEVGREAAKEIASRLGEHRCRVVTLPHKDVNECLQAGLSDEVVFECVQNAAFFDPEELHGASEFKQETIDAFYKQDSGLFKSPWRILNQNFSFRDSELTLVNGVNGHGKTEVVGHMALEAMAQGVRCCVASLEIKPGKLLQRLTRQALCIKTPPRNEIDLAFDWYNDRLWLFNVTGTAKSDRLLEIFAYARKRYGIQLFVIDSLMKCGVGEDDYNGQKEFVDRLCDFKNKNSCHIILVTHSRKADSEDKPTGKMDVKGTGAITDLADNLFIIWRNKLRERALQKQTEQGPQALDEKEQKYLALPASILSLEKQRNGEGWEGQQPLWLEPRSHQFMQAEGESPLNYVANRRQDEIDHDFEMNNVTRAA